jgi:hypothetical protein
MPNDTRPACEGMDPELFFGNTTAAAIAACDTCPIREQCAAAALAAELDFALSDDGPNGHPYRGGAIQAYGYIGGLTARQRTGILTRRGRAHHAATLAAAA